MAIVIRQAVNNAGKGVAATTCVCTIAATTGGSTVHLLVAADSFGATSIAGGSGSYVKSKAGGNAHNFCDEWIGTGIAAGTTSITVTFGGITNSGVQIVETTGEQATSTDTTNTANGVSTAPASGSVTPTTPTNIVIGVAVTNSIPTAGPSGGFTPLTPFNWVGTRYISTGYLIQASAAAAAIGYTMVSGNWDATIVAYKGVAAFPHSQMVVA